MMKISKDNLFYYLTSVTNNRLKVFQKDTLKKIAAEAFDKARLSAEILIFAYAIMPDYHLITNPSRKSSHILRYFNGISARRIIDYLKDNKFSSSLEKMRRETKKRGYKFSLWEHHPNVVSINNETTLMQKVNYIQQNPVRAGLVERAENHLFSSSRIWRKCPIDDEPLTVNIDKIEWREA